MGDRFPEGWRAVDHGYTAVLPMDDGRLWGLMPLLLGRFRIVILEDQWTAGEHWCFGDPVLAVQQWCLGPDHEPEGWTRHMHPDGSKEWPDGRTEP